MGSFRLKQIREKSGMSQKQLSLKLGIAQTTVSGWENESKKPSIDTVLRIADIFNVSLDYLLGRTENPQFSFSTAPMVEITEEQKTIIEAYKRIDPTTQSNIRMLLGVVTGIDRRAQAKKA